MDTRFSSAIHTLILVSEAETPMTSDQIAVSVGTNGSYIRKLTGLLRRSGILESRQGVSGFRLLIPPEELSLFQIYEAVTEEESVHLFDLHQNPNDECIVGKHIQPMLKDVFRDVETQAEQRLKSTTLADCMDTMRAEIERSGDK